MRHHVVMDSIGRTRWAIAEGYIPSESSFTDPALGTTGVAGLSTMSAAMHGAHAPRVDTMLPNTVNKCYACHPGFRNKPDASLPDAVLWFFVGIRCSACGLLGCFNDGKVGWGPAEEVYRRLPG